MKTRFDGTLWIGAGGQAFRPAEMGTDHLLNTVKMLNGYEGRTSFPWCECGKLPFHD